MKGAVMPDNDYIGEGMAWHIDGLVKAISADTGLPVEVLYRDLLAMVSTTMQGVADLVCEHDGLPSQNKGMFQPRSAAIMAICLLMGRGAWRTIWAKETDRTADPVADRMEVINFLRANGFGGNLGMPEG